MGGGAGDGCNGTRQSEVVWKAIGEAPDVPERTIAEALRLQGEARLMCRVLLSGLEEIARDLAEAARRGVLGERKIESYARRRRLNDMEEHHVVRWVKEPGERYLYSFESVCIHLGLNQEALRAGLVRACREQNSEAVWVIIRQLRREWRLSFELTGRRSIS